MPTTVQKLYESLDAAEQTQVNDYILFILSRKTHRSYMDEILQPIPNEQSDRLASLKPLVGSITTEEAEELETALSNSSTINPGDWQ